MKRRVLFQLLAILPGMSTPATDTSTTHGGTSSKANPQLEADLARIENIGKYEDVLIPFTEDELLINQLKVKELESDVLYWELRLKEIADQSASSPSSVESTRGRLLSAKRLLIEKQIKLKTGGKFKKRHLYNGTII